MVSLFGDSVKLVIYGVSLFGYTDSMEARDHALELNARVAKILSDRRDQLGLSLRQIEQKSGVNYMTVKRLLDGTREMRMDDFRAIANALGLSAWRVVQQAEQGTDTHKPVPVILTEPDRPAIREAERSLEEQADERSKPADVIDFPHTQEENLPDFTKLAARKVTNRPEWEKRQALDGIGEENQDPVDY